MEGRLTVNGEEGTLEGVDFFIMVVMVVTWLYICDYSLNWTLKISLFFMYSTSTKNYKQTVYVCQALLGVWLDKCDVGPPGSSVCGHGMERFTVQGTRTLGRSAEAQRKEYLIREGPTREPWVLIWWLNRSQTNVEGKDILGKGMQVGNCMLCFISHREPGIVGALVSWGLCGSSKRWSWTGWQR